MLIRSSDRSRLHRRQCVACGYSGQFVERAQQSHCPRCSCDFAVRPPRSYAEMEGLEDPSSRRSLARARAFSEPPREWRLVERWLVFIFLLSVAAVSLLAIAIATVPLR